MDKNNPKTVQRSPKWLESAYPSTSFITWNMRNPNASIVIPEMEASILTIFCEQGEILASVEQRKLLKVDGQEIAALQHNAILDLSVDGDRWEGDVLDSNPFGWGIAYDKNGNKSYEGFRLAGVNACFGCEYYSDIDRIAYEGTWFEGKRWGRGTQFDRNGDMVYEGYWMDDAPVKDRVEVTSDDSLFHNRAKHLIVGNNLWNDVTCIKLHPQMISGLVSLIIGNQCCVNVAGLDIVNLNQLEQIEIGSGSFTAVNCHASPRAFHVSECPKLKVLKIGPWSFSSYTECTIKRLPALGVIEIGDMDDASYNFYKSSIRITGNSRGE